MKKKLISMLLAVLMVASLFAGTSVSAYADETEQVIEYTMKQGDTVLKVCQANGINYYTCKNAIMKLNGFSSDADFRFIPVGKVIKIPASNAAAVEISSAGTTGSTGGSTGSTGSTVTSSSDSVAYYLVPYTMQRGETIYTVCSALGINYGTYAKQIQSINNLSSLSNVKAGQTILFPQTKAPAVGTSCYKVMNHKVVSGETAYTICSINGVSYNGNLKLLQALNSKDNLNYIKAGSSFYVPVQTVIQAAQSNNNNNNNSSSNNNNSNNSNNSSSSGENVKKYALTAANTAGGTVGFYVDSKAVTSAAAGDIVTIVATPDKNYAVSSIDAVYSDGSAAPKLNGDTFVMPTSAVTANVKFIKGYNINVDCTYTNAVKVMVNGVVGSSASEGSQVTVVSGNPSLSVDGKIEIYKTETGKIWKTIDPSKSFDMPSFEVTVKVKMKTVDTYGFYKTVVKDGATVDVSAKNTAADLATGTGSFVLQVNGSTVSKAAEGTTVTVLASPSVGYSISKVWVFECDEETGDRVSVVNVIKGETFTMPADPVEVVVSFTAGSGSINIKSSSHGIIEAQNSLGKKITVATTDSEVTLKATADAGYAADKPIVIRTVDGTLVEVTDAGSGTYTFRMPGGGAEVTPQFVGADTNLTVDFFLNDEKDLSGVNKLRINSDEPAAKYGVGKLLQLAEDPAEGHSFVRYEVLVDGNYDAERTKSANENSSFAMADKDTTIRAYFEAQLVEVKYQADSTYILMWVDAKNYNKSVESVTVGGDAVMIINPKSGEIDDLRSVKVTSKATGEVIGTYSSVYDEATEKYVRTFDGGLAQTTGNNAYDERGVIGMTFKMPAGGVDVAVVVQKGVAKVRLDTSYALKIEGVDEADKFDMICVYGDSYTQSMYENFERKVSVGTNVGIKLTDKATARHLTLDSIKYTVDGETKYIESVNGVCSFVMPGGNVNITEVNCSCARVNISAFQTNLSNCTIEFVESGNKLNKVSSYKVGDTVCFRITPKSGYAMDALGGGGVASLFNLDDGTDITSSLTGPDAGGYYTFVLSESTDNVRIEASASNNKTAYKVTVTGLAAEHEGFVTLNNSSQGKSWALSDTVTEGYGYAKDRVTLSLTGIAKDNLTAISINGTPVTVNGGGSYTFTMDYNDATIDLTF